MIFILSIFGYMLLLIVLKWLTVFNITSCAPSILVGKLAELHMSISCNYFVDDLVIIELY